MSRLRGARPADEEAAVVEPLGDLGCAHHPHPGRGEFDGQRQPVQSLTDLGDGAPDLPIRLEVGAGPAGSVDEQRRRVAVGQRSHRPHLFPVDPEGLPARREHDDTRAVRNDVTQQSGGCGQHVLAVVQDEQRRPRLQVLDHRLLDREAVALLHPERSGDGVADGPVVGERSKLAHPDPVGKSRPFQLGHLEGETRLADPTDPSEGHQLRGTGRGGQPGQFRVPTDETGTSPRKIAAAGDAGRPQRRIVCQHLAMQFLGLFRWFDPQLVDETAP